MNRFAKFSVIMILLSNIVCFNFAYAACTNNGNGTWTTASSSRSDCQDCVTAANPGDTIYISSSGSPATWGTAITISKSLTIDGGGSYSVKGTHEDVGMWPVSINPNGQIAFTIAAFDGDSIRITGIRFSGSSHDNGAIQFDRSNNADDWRIDNWEVTF